MELNFKEKVVAVTGAGHGFGLAIAQDFARRGGTVHATLAPGQQAPEAGGIAFSLVDLTDRAQIADWVGTIERRTGKAIDVLVNNAGGVSGRIHVPVDEVSFDDWDAVLAINIGATFGVCRAAAGAMKRQGSGRIVNISSNAGLRPSLTGIQAYTAAKHAIVGLTKQLAIELGPHGITVNAIAPGFFNSNPDSERQWASYGEAGQAALIGRTALRRLGSPQDIASACIFFASELAGYVTGQILSVDGGRP